MILVKKYWKKLESSINLESRDSYSYPDWYTHTCMNNFNVNFYLFLWFDQTKLETFALFWANMKISCFTHTQTHIRQVAFDLVQCVYVCDQSQSRKKSHSKRDYGIPTYDENAKSCFSFVFDWLRGFSWSIVFSSFFIVVRKKHCFSTTMHSLAFDLNSLWNINKQKSFSLLQASHISYQNQNCIVVDFSMWSSAEKTKFIFDIFPLYHQHHTRTHTHTPGILLLKKFEKEKNKKL